MKKIEDIIKETNDQNQDKVDWTSAWSTKYPVLKKYQDETDCSFYAGEIRKLLDKLQEDYGYSRQDAMLVLKDILYHTYKDKV